MNTWTPTDLINQFNRTSTRGWLQAFVDAAHKYNFPVEMLLGISSRETNISQIIGDGGHGFSLMQIDNRSFPQWCASGAWRDVHQAVDKGAQVLQNKQQELSQYHTFADPTDLLRCSIAAYNCGAHAALQSFLIDGNPDRHTTGGDYSADVFQRAVIFADQLSK